MGWQKVIGLVGVILVCTCSLANGDSFPDPSLFKEPFPAPGLTVEAGSLSLDPEGDYMVFHWGSGPALKEAYWNGSEWTNMNSLSLGGLGWETWPSLSITFDHKWLFYNASTGVEPAVIYRSQGSEDNNGIWNWGPGEPLSGGIASFFAPGMATFYENRLYLRKWISHTQSHIYVSEYDPITDTFAEPTATEFININDESNNYPSQRIGNTLLFQSDRDGTYDIWMSKWNDELGLWNEPEKLPSPINSDTCDEGTPWYFQPTRTLYFNRHTSPKQTYQTQADIPVNVDIKPGSCPNPLKLKCKGVLPIAILGTDELDVSTIDPNTIMITREVIEGGVPLIQYNYEDVGTPFKGEPCECHDLNGDGYLDITLKFSLEELIEGLMLNDIEDRGTVPLIITGGTYDGTSIRGEDCAWILGALPYHPADTNQDQTIDMLEISAYTELWYQGLITEKELNEALEIWYMGYYELC
jgi:hypothetical protein